MKGRFLIRRRERQSGAASGQALVELAMVLAFGSILLLLGLGVVEFGKLTYWSIEVANAAKAGAQYGGQGQSNAQDGTGIQNAAYAAAQDLSTLATNPPVTSSLTVTPTLSCVCSSTGAYSSWSSSAGCTLATCPTAVKFAVTVNTSVTVSPPYALKGFASSYTLTGSATQECLQ